MLVLHSYTGILLYVSLPSVNDLCVAEQHAALRISLEHP